MKKLDIISMNEAFERFPTQAVPKYWHDSLPEAFIEKAGRVFDRLKGIDYQADRISKDEWIDEFKGEFDFEAALDIHIQCLKAVAKVERKFGKQTALKSKGIYYLALTRSMCKDAEEAFCNVRAHFGFEFLDSEKEHLMRIVDSCVKYVPLVVAYDSSEPSEDVAVLHPFFQNDPNANN